MGNLILQSGMKARRVIAVVDKREAGDTFIALASTAYAFAAGTTITEPKLDSSGPSGPKASLCTYAFEKV